MYVPYDKRLGMLFVKFGVVFLLIGLAIANKQRYGSSQKLNGISYHDRGLNKNIKAITEKNLLSLSNKIDTTEDRPQCTCLEEVCECCAELHIKRLNLRRETCSQVKYDTSRKFLNVSLTYGEKYLTHSLRDLSSLSILGNLGNLGKLSNLGNLVNLSNLSHFGNLSNLSNLSNLGNLSNVGNISNLANLNNLPHLNNLVNLSSLSSSNSINNLKPLSTLISEGMKIGPICANVPLPSSLKGFIKLCMLIYNIKVVMPNLEMCLDLQTYIRGIEKPVLVLHFTCFTMGLDPARTHAH